VTRSFGGVTLTRPAPAAAPGPLDERFYDLVEARFRRVVESEPVLATYLGIHAWDEDLGDATRDHVLADLDEERAHLAAVEALDVAGLSPEARFERDLEIHNLRRVIFDTAVVRRWERRSTSMDAVGDALFPLFTRDFAPLDERLMAIAGRLEKVPGYLREHRTRAEGRQVRAWQRIELTTGESLPSFLDEITAAAEGLAPAERRRLEAAADRAKEAIADQADWVHETLARGTDDWPLGRDLYDELVGLRAFDGLDSDAILEIGWSQLEENHAARRAAAREIDPDAPVEDVVDRVKSDHPATFAEALDAYRVAMARTRAYLVDHAIATVPDDERVEVIETPEYLRGVMPFAAYFEAPKFDPSPIGLYVVTPSVDHDPGAMREHYYASISNTSIHEAYPGHHLQLAVGARHPSLTRLLTEAPEFVEGWGMYSEQMMREQGFDDGPAFRVALATDAIWRAARIVLDIRMHRGEVSIEEATEFLIEHTRFERPNALAEVRRYTYTPTYQLSYLLGKVMILGLRDGQRRRLGDAFSLREFHDSLLRNGSLPVSFHRRLLEAG
jgi:uncharacterized protein (DUF885 family)